MRKLEDLIPKLVLKTEQRSVDWKETEIENKFQATVGKFEVGIWKWEDPDDGTKGISLGLRTAGMKDFADVIYYDKYSGKYPKLEELHSSARRSALNVEKMLNELDAELDDFI